MKKARVALIGDRDLLKIAHQGIESSLALYEKEAQRSFDCVWIDTASIDACSLPELFRDTTGIWCIPGSPYANTFGALLAIQHARVQGKAFLGTCGGFQHALMEFAGNVLQHCADHQELTPDAENPLIVKLSCSLADIKGKVFATSPELFSEILGALESTEEFNCNYGVNENLAETFTGSDLIFVAHDEQGQIRAFRLKHHPFFVGTLFQPERKALLGSLHPIVRAFFKASESNLQKV